MTGENSGIMILKLPQCHNSRYITQNIDYSYTFELPEHDEDGAHGFLLPASNIVKVFSAQCQPFMKTSDV